MIDKEYDPSTGCIVKLTPDNRLHLADKFQKSRMENLENPDVQLHSVVSGRKSDDYAGNVEKHRLSQREVGDFFMHEGIKIYNGRFREVLNDIPLKIRNNVILAGSAALVDIIGSGINGDYDLFIVGTNKPKKVLKVLVKYFIKRISVNRIFRTAHSVSLKTNFGLIQIVLRSYRNAAEVVLGFDLDASGCYYNPSKKAHFCTQRAYYSIKRAINFVDVDRASETYATRLTKYAFKGFSVFIPVTLTVQHFDEAHRLASSMQAYCKKERNNIKSFVELRSKFNQSLVGLLAGLSLGVNAFRKFIKYSETDYCPISEESMLKKLSYSKNFEKQPGVSFVETEEDGITIGYGFNPHAYVNLRLLFKIKPGYLTSDKTFPALEFITDNPGTQHTASFHPVEMTWDKWTESIYLAGKAKILENIAPALAPIPASSPAIPIVTPLQVKFCGCTSPCRCITITPPKIPVLPQAESSSQRKSCGCRVDVCLCIQLPPKPVPQDFITEDGVRLSVKDLAKLKELLR